MTSSALLRYSRIAPRKVRIVASLISGKKVEEAINALTFSPRRAAVVLRKLLYSAIANAEDRGRGKVEVDDLTVASVRVDQGPTLKRWRPRAMGRAYRIKKRTSHIEVVVSDETS